MFRDLMNSINSGFYKDFEMKDNKADDGINETKKFFKKDIADMDREIMDLNNESNELLNREMELQQKVTERDQLRAEIELLENEVQQLREKDNKISEIENIRFDFDYDEMIRDLENYKRGLEELDNFKSFKEKERNHPDLTKLRGTAQELREVREYLTNIYTRRDD